MKRGDPLFEIDSPEVVQAQTDLIAAVQALDKAQVAAQPRQAHARPADRPAMPARPPRSASSSRRSTDHTVAETDLKTAEGALTAARNRLRVISAAATPRSPALEQRADHQSADHRSTAPIDGTVIARKVGPGQYVRSDSGEPLYSIADLSIDVAQGLRAGERHRPSCASARRSRSRSLALPDRVFKARIVAIGAASDAATRRVVVRSEIPNPDGALKSEMFATFKIVTGDGEPDAARAGRSRDPRRRSSVRLGRAGADACSSAAW